LDSYFYDPAAGHGLSHDPFKAIVGPRPIGWVSTQDAAGRRNLAPYSFFNAVCDNPQMIAFSSNGRKDSVRNAEATGEFVWNLATLPLAEQMNRTSAPVDHGVDEFVLAGLDPAPSRNVSPPRVADTPAALECKVASIINLTTIDGTATDQWLVIGQVVGVHIRPEYIGQDGLFDTAAAQPILRAGYLADYAAISPAAMFKMRRPTA